MKYLGFAYTDGAYGPIPPDTRKPEEVVPFTSLYVCWITDGYWKKGETKDRARERMASCLAKAKKNYGKRFAVFVQLNGQMPADFDPGEIKANLRILAPHWSAVVAVMVADEPSWTKAETKTNLALVRGLIGSLGLAPKPLGVGLTIEASAGLVGDVAGGKIIEISKKAGLDFVAVECFVDHHLQDQGTPKNVAAITKTVKTSFARMSSGVRAWLWVQTFNRNGAFPNEKNLAALVWPSYLLGRDDPRVDGFLCFNWARHNSANSWGAKNLPLVTAEVKRVAKDLGIA